MAKTRRNNHHSQSKSNKKHNNSNNNMSINNELTNKINNNKVSNSNNRNERDNLNVGDEPILLAVPCTHVHRPISPLDLDSEMDTNSKEFNDGEEEEEMNAR